MRLVFTAIYNTYSSSMGSLSLMFVGSQSSVVTWPLILDITNNWPDDLTGVVINFYVNGVTLIATQNVGNVAPGAWSYNLGPYPSELSVTCQVQYTDGDGPQDVPAMQIIEYNFTLEATPPP